jgi:hypothetical protein
MRRKAGRAEMLGVDLIINMRKDGHRKLKCGGKLKDTAIRLLLITFKAFTYKNDGEPMQ